MFEVSAIPFLLLLLPKLAKFALRLFSSAVTGGRGAE